jgi:phenylacetic acid degradation operon negative regulatory protein
MELRDDTRPLTARSVVASTLLGVRPSVLPARSLVASAGLFGIAEGTVRTAMSRMVAAGELTLDDGRYALAGRFLSRRQRQDESRSGQTRPWVGDWELAVVEGERRLASDRSALRRAMRDLRQAELREGVWLRPANLHPGRLPEARAVVATQCLAFTGRHENPAALAARLWDLDGWAAAARRLEAELTALGPRLDHPDQLAAGFVLSAAVLRHLQADPLLPPELLPPDWPGPSLRQGYETYDATFKSAWTTRLRASA